MWVQEGFRSFYKGITPRVLRVAPGKLLLYAVLSPVVGFVITSWILHTFVDQNADISVGQAVVFAVYERVRKLIEQAKMLSGDHGDSYTE